MRGGAYDGELLRVSRDASGRAGRLEFPAFTLGRH
jgi:hypothetical protein